jgi:hypothetical protein
VEYDLKTQKEVMELNLENPIFVVYMNVDGISRQRADELFADLSNYMSYQNITKWIIPIKNGDSRVELIWQGSKYSTNPGIVNFNNFENLINRFNEVIEVISNGTDDASIKQQLRNLQLKKIIDDDTSI